MLGLATIAYSDPKFLSRMVESAYKSSAAPTLLFLFIHSSNPELVKACYEIEAKYPTILFDYQKNRGVARSWNDAIVAMMNLRCWPMIITNDDIYFSKDDFRKITLTAFRNDVPMIFCGGWHDGYDSAISSHGMACFAIQRIAVETIGYFDENFFPAYNEDNDYARRMALAGMKAVIAPDTMVHHTGSVAIRTVPELGEQNKRTHDLNNEYWWKKWQCGKNDGVDTGFTQPFNEEQFHPYHISLKERHAPYEGYNRVDRGIVRL